MNIDFEVTSYLLIIYSAFFQYLRKMGTNQAMYQLFSCFKEAYDSDGREVFYKSVIDFVIPMKLEIETKGNRI
jgi:hypothetical protein